MGEPLLQRAAYRAREAGPHCRHVAPHLVRDRARDRAWAWVRDRVRVNVRARASVRVSERVAPHLLGRLL